jgi:HlyD family secretion protein
MVGPGDPVYSVSLEDPLWVRAYVDEPDLGRIGPGDRVTVKNDLGESREGRVGFVSPRAEFTPKNVETENLRTDLVYRLRIVIEDHEGGSFRRGMPVTITLNKEEGEKEVREEINKEP